MYSIQTVYVATLYCCTFYNLCIFRVFSADADVRTMLYVYLGDHVKVNPKILQLAKMFVCVCRMEHSSNERCTYDEIN